MSYWKHSENVLIEGVLILCILIKDVPDKQCPKLKLL